MRKLESICVSFALAGLMLHPGCTKLDEGLPAPTSGQVQVHPAGWGDTNSTSFHGKFLSAKAWQLSNCTPCHGDALGGGTAGVSCFTCHKSYPHSAGWTDSTTAGLHGNFIQASGWDMRQCQTCHGVTYAGGRVNVSCLTCHTKPNGPENCTTCHGGINAAPPRDLSGNTSTTARGVGAHQAHLLGSSLASPLLCSECHNVPSSVYQAGHIGSTGHAEIHFNGPLGTLKTAGGTFVPAPSYDVTTGKCSNTFCHGNWRHEESTSAYQWAFKDTVMAGANYSPSWTGGSSESACDSSCHGLPPAGHLQTADKCAQCHTGVVDFSGNIIDSTKHINGKVDVFGQDTTIFHSQL